MDPALQAHPSVRAAQAQLQVAQARRNAALGEGLPSLSLSASRYLNGRPNTPLSSSRSFESLVTLQWNFPLFEGFARGYKIREAQAQIGAREADLTAARIQASQEVWRQYQTLQVETKACLAAGDLLASSSELQTAARARYAAGAVDVTETLNALKDHAFARQEGIRALTAWRSARLRLLASLGRLGLWSIDPAAGAAATPAPR
jgi:outer membrane protein